MKKLDHDQKMRRCQSVCNPWFSLPIPCCFLEWFSSYGHMDGKSINDNILNNDSILDL